MTALVTRVGPRVDDSRVGWRGWRRQRWGGGGGSGGGATSGLAVTAEVLTLYVADGTGGDV